MGVQFPPYTLMDVSPSGKAAVLHTAMREFDPLYVYAMPPLCNGGHNGPVAPMVERLLCKQTVVSSNLIWSTDSGNWGRYSRNPITRAPQQTECSLVWLKRLLWEQETGGSNPPIPTYGDVAQTAER